MNCPKETTRNHKFETVFSCVLMKETEKCVLTLVSSTQTKTMESDGDDIVVVVVSTFYYWQKAKKNGVTGCIHTMFSIANILPIWLQEN